MLRRGMMNRKGLGMMQMVEVYAMGDGGTQIRASSALRDDICAQSCWRDVHAIYAGMRLSAGGEKCRVDHVGAAGKKTMA